MDEKQLKDHKQLGQELELFFTDEIAPGASFWLPKGMVIFKELEKYIRELTEEAGYKETSTPIMVKNQLFKDSSHWEKFGEHNIYNLALYEDTEISYFLEEFNKRRDEIFNKVDWENPKPFFVTINISPTERVEVYMDPRKTPTGNPEIVYQMPVNYSLKPMNCPESTILYRFRPRSYRELPLRLSEIGRLHRREKSGEVNGLLRVRQLTMDDAHTFATEDQIFDEVSNILDMMMSFYKKFGFEYEFRLATRPEVRAGADEGWDKAEKDLEKVLKRKKIQAGDKMGDGAFYGPKIDVHIKDSQGREWQLATVQLDFHQPEAFELEYTDEKGEKQKPVMIHRAIFGSFERFIAILTEHFQGSFPTWLSPIQAIIIPIADRHQKYAQGVFKQLTEAKIRVETDERAETMQSKIRDAQNQKIPYMLIVGDREEKGNQVAVRSRKGEDLGAISIEVLIEKIKTEIDSKI